MTRVALLIAVTVLLLGAALFARGLHNRSVVDKSISGLNDSKNFVTSARAAQTVADISTRLRFAGASCRPRHAPRCTVMLQAAAYSAVTAYTLTDCTSPGVYDGRKAMQDYLHAVKKFLKRAAKAPSVPKVITC
jgi:hypothetical protein